MAAINLETASPSQADIMSNDLKQAAIQVQPVQLDTPATTPDQNSPLEADAMAGKKAYAFEKPTDKARELAAKLTLEEQVRTLLRKKERESAGASNTQLDLESEGKLLLRRRSQQLQSKLFPLRLILQIRLSDEYQSRSHTVTAIFDHVLLPSRLDFPHDCLNIFRKGKNRHYDFVS